MPNVVLVNRAPRIRDARFAALLPALQAQVNEDFAPHWQPSGPDGSQPTTILHLAGHAQEPERTHWKIWLLGTSDQPGTLGHHETAGGIPQAEIFVEDDLRYGAEISVTISHELLEMLADPYINQVGPTIDGAQYMREVCDAVEADGDAYLKGKFLVSNFVLPSYYKPGSLRPWDYRQRLAGPCPALRPGGYNLYLKDGVWATTAARYADGSLSHRAFRPFGRSAQRAAKGVTS